jgi:hypothetical protein
MSDDNNSSGWNTLVLQQLESLNHSISAMSAEISDVKNQLTELKAKEDRVYDLKEWKEKISEVASPTQLSATIKDVEELKEFKTKSITIFAVVQFFMATAMALTKFF